jgi:hypothetical protein
MSNNPFEESAADDKLNQPLVPVPAGPPPPIPDGPNWQEKETPRWAQNSESGAPVPAGPPPSGSGPRWVQDNAGYDQRREDQLSGGWAQPADSFSNVTEGEINNMLKFIRFMNIGIGGFYIAVAILAWINGDVLGIPTTMATMYCVLFGSLLLAFELRIARVRSVVRAPRCSHTLHDQSLFAHPLPS